MTKKILVAALVLVAQSTAFAVRPGTGPTNGSNGSNSTHSTNAAFTAAVTSAAGKTALDAVKRYVELSVGFQGALAKHVVSLTPEHQGKFVTELTTRLSRIEKLGLPNDAAEAAQLVAVAGMVTPVVEALDKTGLGRGDVATFMEKVAGFSPEAKQQALNFIKAAASKADPNMPIAVALEAAREAGNIKKDVNLCDACPDLCKK